LNTVPKVDGKVWLHHVGETAGRQVTLSENYYFHPVLSPTYDKFFCHSQRGDLVVFDTLGKVLGNLGLTDFESWNPNGDRIVFCVIEEAGEPGDIVASDIYVAKWDGTERTQITSSADRVELYPSFSPSGTKLLYRDHRSEKLFVINLKKGGLR
jgi:Tol biopolymer transport system component